MYIHSPIRLHGVVLNKLSTGTALALPLRTGVLVYLKRLLLGKVKLAFMRILGRYNVSEALAVSIFGVEE
jgi:hypothetical protein